LKDPRYGEGNSSYAWKVGWSEARRAGWMAGCRFVGCCGRAGDVLECCERVLVSVPGFPLACLVGGPEAPECTTKRPKAQT
jgi:hypothetical protein